MVNLLIRTVFALLLCSSISIALSADLAPTMSLESEIKGQQAQPKVLFILPWQQQKESNAIDIDLDAISNDDFLAPIERSVFQRETRALKLYDQGSQ